MKSQQINSFLKFWRFGIFLNGAIFWLLVVSLNGFAQQGTPQRGAYSQGSYALSNIENINAANGNLMFHLPLGSLPAGRKGMGGGIGLHYNSKLYDSWFGFACDYQNNCEDAVEQLYASPEGGWRYGFEYKLQVYTRPQPADCSDPRGWYIYKVVMSFPDGSIHEFRPYGFNDYSNEGYYQVSPNGYGINNYCAWTLFTSNTMTYYSTDSSYLRLEVQHDTNDGWENNPWTLYLPDGGRVTFNEPGSNGQRIYDSNNNFVEVRNLILPNGNTANRVVDQFNRTLEIEHTGLGTDYVRIPGANGQTLTWTITWTAINSWAWNNGYYSLGGGGTPFDFGLPLVSGIGQIISPSQAGGFPYSFSYNIAPGLVEGFGEIKSITLPSADQNKAYATYAYYSYGYASVYDVQHHPITQKSLKYLKQHDNPTTFDDPDNYLTEVWTYNIPNHDGGGASTITSPDGGVVTEWAYGSVPNTWQGGLLYKSERPDGTIVERIWLPNTPQSPYLATDVNPYVKTEYVSLKDASGILVRTAITDYNYDKNGNLTQKAEYDFVDYATVPRDGNGRPTGIPAGAVLKKVTVNTYNSPTPDAADKTTVTPNAYNKPGSPNVRGAVDSSEVRSGFSDTTALTRTEFFYDNVQTTANPIQIRIWDSRKNNTPQAITRPLTTTNSSSVFTQYDAYGNITLVTDARNVQTKFEYDSACVGNTAATNLYPCHIRKAFGTTIQLNSSLTYDFNTGLSLTATDNDNNVTNKTIYDDLGRPTLVREAYSQATDTAVRHVSTQYLDASRTVITRSDLTTVGDGKIVSIQHHDQLGRLRLSRSLEDPAQSATDETVGIKVQTRFLTTSTHSYKIVSNPYRAVSSTTASSEYTMGWSLEKADRSGRVIVAESFDGSGLPAPWGTNANSTGLSTIVYDANFTTSTDAAGKIKRTMVDGLGRLVRTDEPNASNNLGEQISPIQPTSYIYDALNRMTQVSQGVQTRSFDYSSLSRLLSATNPEKNGPDTYEYDANGNVTKHTDARGWYATSTFDELNRVKTIDYSNTAVNPDIKKFYDNPTAGKYGKGRYWYDYAGGDNTTGQTVEHSAVDAYDILGRPLSMRQQFKTSGAWSQSFTTSHLYDLAGNVKEKTLPSNRKITYIFDVVGRLSQMAGNIGDGVQRTYTSNIAYTAAGQMAYERFGTSTNLHHNRHFNNRGQLYDVRLGTGSDQGAEWTWNRGALRIFYGANYAYGNGGTLNNGSVYREDHFIPQNDAASLWFMPVQYYGYDELNRINGAWEQTFNQSGTVNLNTLGQTYTYDRYGNRTVNSTWGGVTSPSFKYVPASNRQKAPTDTDTDATSDKMRYDAVGNLIKDSHTQTSNNGDKTYDINNQMLSAVGLNGLLDTYAYDAAGHRVRRSINNGASNWWQVYGIGGEMVAEYAAGAAPNMPLKEYGYRLGEMLVVSDAVGCTTRWLVTDQIGTPRILADTTGSLAGISRHDYLPFGEELYAGYGGRNSTMGYTGDCVRDKFAGYERDAETGLDFAEARYHGSVYGRFTSVDPAMGSARKSMPQSWNRYTYVMNRPLSLVDPTGEYWLWNPANGQVNFGKPGPGPKIGSEEWKKVTNNGQLKVLEDGATFDIVASKSTGIYANYGGKKVRLNKNGTMDVVGLTESRKVVDLPSTGAGTGIVLTAVALSPIGLAPAAAAVAVEAPVGTTIASAILLHVVLEAAMQQKGDVSPKKEDDDVFVVRGGIATPEQLQKGVAEHLAVPGLTGFSVQSEPGKTVEELSAAGEYKNGQVSVTTVRELESAGVSLVSSPGRGHHKTVVTPMPLSNDQAAKISAVFKPRPNPAIAR